jgi:hypothetical protein
MLMIFASVCCFVIGKIAVVYQILLSSRFMCINMSCRILFTVLFLLFVASVHSFQIIFLVLLFAPLHSTYQVGGNFLFANAVRVVELVLQRCHLVSRKSMNRWVFYAYVRDKLSYIVNQNFIFHQLSPVYIHFFKKK